MCRDYLLCFEDSQGGSFLLFFHKNFFHWSLGDFRWKDLSEFRWKDLSDRLEKVAPKKIVSEFLEYVCYEKSFKEFPAEFKNSDAQVIIQEYNDFLKKSCYVFSGKARMGAFLIWRGIIKYLELLHKEKEFYTSKGRILENWCYDKAVKYGFQPEKIILINPKRDPTPKFRKMKEQIRDFPRPPLEFEAEFPDEYSKFYFQEIDFVIKIKDRLFFFEVKGTSVPTAEEPKIISWMSRYFDELQLLESKIALINYNVNQEIIKHEIFKGVHTVIPNIIKNEGVFGKKVQLPTYEYVNYLKELRRNLDQGTFEEWILERFFNE